MKTGNSKKTELLAFTLCAMLFALSTLAEAQQPAKITRIGYLDAVSLSINAARVEAFDKV